MSLSVGSLFSGIGGFDLGLERAGMSVKWQVENNPYCRRVLTKHWPDVPCYGDITTRDWTKVEAVDLVCGGFPCQPFSVAGQRRGASDDRYLWPEVVRCLSTLRPAWFLGENVPGIINMALDQVCTDLESLGYAVWPVCVPACAVDAPHQRQRLWIVAYANSIRLQGRVIEHGVWKENGGVETEVRACPWAGWNGVPESRVCRVAHGVPHRVDRLKSLGNTIVPQIAEILGRMILQSEHRQRELEAFL